MEFWLKLCLTNRISKLLITTFKAIFESLCSVYEGNQQVKEAKPNMLVQQSELFKMKEYEDIETMFSRFGLLYLAFKFWEKKKKTYHPIVSRRFLGVFLQSGDLRLQLLRKQRT